MIASVPWRPLVYHGRPTVTIQPRQDTGFGLPIEAHGPNAVDEDLDTSVDPPVVIRKSQAIVQDWQYNAYGQVINEIDPEGFVMSHFYLGANDPSGVFGQTFSAGGYLFMTVMDNGPPQLRTPSQPLAPGGPVQSRTIFTRDRVGNTTALTDPRGIIATFFVNERNQVQLTTFAVGHVFPTDERGRPFVDFGYKTRVFHDGNDNVTVTQVQNEGPLPGLVANHPWITTSHGYDLLDHLVETTRDVSMAGESITLLQGITTTPRVYAIGSGTEQVTERFRYDRNGNKTLDLSPLAVYGSDPDNVVSAIFDERNLLYKATRGGVDAQFSSMPNQLGSTATPSVSARTVSRFVDAGGSQTSVVDAVGHTTRTRLDGFNRPRLTSTAMGFVRVSTYDPDTAVIERRAHGPLGGNATGSGLPLSGDPTDAVLARAFMQHDELGRRFRDDADYFQTPGTRLALYSQRMVFDRRSLPIRRANPKLDRVDMEYDGKGRLVHKLDSPVDNSAGTDVRNEWRFFYDAADDLLARLDTEASTSAAFGPDLFGTEFFYDSLRRNDLTVDNLFHAYRSYFDSRGNVVATTDAAAWDRHNPTATPRTVSQPLLLRSTPQAITVDGNPVVHVFDGLNRAILTDRELRRGGDSSGALDVWDPTTGLGNPNNADGLVTTRRSFDKNSRITSEADDNGHTTSYAWNERNLPTTTTYADGSTRQVLTYNLDDLVIATHDPNGSILARTYDPDHRITSLSSLPADGGLTGPGVQAVKQLFERDGLDRVTHATDLNDPSVAIDASNVSLAWDSLSREFQETQQSGGLAPRTITRAFDPNSNVTQLGYSSGRLVTFGYLALGCSCTRNELTRAEEGAGQGSGDNITPTNAPNTMIAAYEYEGPCPRCIAVDTGDGSKLSIRYDGNREPLAWETTNAGTTVSGFQYARDNNELRIAEGFEDASGALQTANEFFYSSIYQVTGVHLRPNFSPSFPLATTRYVVDGAHNFSTIEMTQGNGSSPPTLIGTITFNAGAGADVVNRYTRVDKTSGGTTKTDFPSYDANGNLTADSDPRRLFWDALDRLVRVELSFDGGVTWRPVGTYKYDALGRRVRKDATVWDPTGAAVLKTEQVQFVLDGPRVIEEVSTATNTVVADYVWGPNYIDEAVQIRRGGQTYYYHTNALYSVASLTDASGAVVERVSYSSIYGAHQVTDATGNVKALPAEVGNPYRFQGMRFDQESGLFYFRNRYMDPFTGRFVGRDPLGTWGDSSQLGNAYSFCADDPVNQSDPYGTGTHGSPDPTDWGEDAENAWRQIKDFVKSLVNRFGKSDAGRDDPGHEDQIDQDCKRLLEHIISMIRWINGYGRMMEKEFTTIAQTIEDLWELWRRCFERDWFRRTPSGSGPRPPHPTDGTWNDYVNSDEYRNSPDAISGRTYRIGDTIIYPAEDPIRIHPSQRWSWVPLVMVGVGVDAGIFGGVVVRWVYAGAVRLLKSCPDQPPTPKPPVAVPEPVGAGAGG